MTTKYNISLKQLAVESFFLKLVGKIFKILPMFEEDSDTLSVYVLSLSIELSGIYSLLSDNEDILSLLCSLQGLYVNLDDMTHSQLKSQVLKCTNLCKRISESYREDVVE